MSDKAAGQKARSPEGCDENGPAAALLLSHVSIQVCSFVAPCRRPILIATPLHQSLTWCTRWFVSQPGAIVVGDIFSSHIQQVKDIGVNAPGRIEPIPTATYRSAVTADLTLSSWVNARTKVAKSQSYFESIKIVDAEFQHPIPVRRFWGHIVRLSC